MRRRRQPDDTSVASASSFSSFPPDNPVRVIRSWATLAAWVIAVGVVSVINFQAFFLLRASPRSAVPVAVGDAVDAKLVVRVICVNCNCVCPCLTPALSVQVMSGTLRSGTELRCAGRVLASNTSSVLVLLVGHALEVSSFHSAT